MPGDLAGTATAAWVIWLDVGPATDWAGDGCRGDDLRAWVAREPYNTQIRASTELDRMVVFGPERGWVDASRAG